MKIGGRKIGLKLSGRVALLHNRLSRARYFRGHGVHSPFVYDIVRNVFMRKELLSGDMELFGVLLGIGICERRAIELQNLAIHCGYRTFGLNCADAEFCILTSEQSRSEALAQVRIATQAGHTVALLSPYAGRGRQMLCRHIIAQHGSTTVDNGGYLLIFNSALPKQHFRI